MQKQALQVMTLCAAILCLCIPTANAQSFFGNNLPDKNSKVPTVANTPPATQHVMTPSEYQSAVKSTNEQEKNAITQQFNANIPSLAPRPGTGSTAKSPSSTDSSTDSTPSWMQGNTNANSNTGTPNQTPIAPVQPKPAAPTPNNSAPASSSPSTPSNQGYTGFGTGNSNTSTPTNNSSGSSSGWGIHY